MNRTKILCTALLAVVLSACADPTDWYGECRENRPYIRWWWMGSAVDREGLTYNLEQFASHGIGGVEITPIYGVQGNEENDIEYLSPKWMEMLGHVISESKRLDLETDMSNCTGWPFGGPWVSVENAAQKFEFDADTTQILMVPTLQKVKRAAPGGEGLVINHYSLRALEQYLAPFDSAFCRSRCPWPDTFFDDSFEVYDSGWDACLRDRFREEHGYDIADRVKAFARNDQSEGSVKVIADYRQTLGRMYIDNFVRPWTEWARRHGVRTRLQAHGAPANLIDVYAMADIPECEAFGQTPFDIKGLHRSGPTRRNDSDRSVFKFASSAAHISGKKYTSCESLTWLTEHFHTTLALCKPEIDLILASGVNHIFLHGAPYAPQGLEFPSWKFYATINLSPSNPSIWDAFPMLARYITRCQAFLTAGEPDADFLIYFPIDDIWRHHFRTQFMMLDIHKMKRTMPEFKKEVNDILAMGYDVDYVSDAFLKDAEVLGDGSIRLSCGAVYRGLIIPEGAFLSENAARKFDSMREEGANILGSAELGSSGVIPERIAEAAEGIHFVRRKNETGGKNYFITNLGPEDLDSWVELATEASSVEFFDAMEHRKGLAQSADPENGCTKVRMQIPSGASLLVKCFPKKVSGLEPWPYYTKDGDAVDLRSAGWNLSFQESYPEMPEKSYALDSLSSWTVIPGGSINQGTGVYSASFPVDRDADEWLLDLGDVRERARVFVNGEAAGEVICAPFTLRIGKHIRKGENSIRIEVTNLPANRIAEKDRRGEVWRIFKDVNIAAVNSRQVVTYEQANSYGWWDTVPSGLNSTVTITPLKKE